MALTRKMLKAMGIEDEKIDQIIEEHISATDALKEKADSYKAKADKADELEKELKEVQQKLGDADNDEYKVKYESEHNAFEQYKKDIEAEKIRTTNTALYKQLLLDAGISEKRVDTILKVTDVSNLEVEDGKIKDSTNMIKSIREEWSDFVVSEGRQGANEPNPPANNSGAMTKESFDKLSLSEQMRFANEHPTEYANLN